MAWDLVALTYWGGKFQVAWGKIHISGDLPDVPLDLVTLACPVSCALVSRMACSMRKAGVSGTAVPDAWAAEGQYRVA
jgi:hypothetical protein